MHINLNIEIQDCICVTRERETILLSAGAQQETVSYTSVVQEALTSLDTAHRTFQFLHFNEPADSPPAGLTAPQ